ncbi:hypothetical protein RSOLAG22IIIB_10186 [Rhizoctonia solani]|uniref:Uncharacterized protein n=1 Tax=Rhizoctonia solani TaxID=456999 RepID=A0A0K6G2M5_9AGAM|nr:hypothetical protein RSOLAG22IIIB_10186 [Rhizoctonia solani]
MNGTGSGVADVESVMPNDGNTRVRFVQPVVKNTVESATSATNVNSDEACVLGTATKSFKAQHPVFHVVYVYLCETVKNKSKDGNPRIIETVAVPIRSTTRLRMALTLKHKQDYDVVVGFKEPTGRPRTDVPTLQYTIMGVQATYHNLTERGATDAAVRLNLLYSKGGLAGITEAVVVVTVKDVGLTGKIDRLFGGEFFRTLDTDSSTVSASEGTKVEGELKKPVEKLGSSEITPILEPAIIKPTSPGEKKAGRKRLIFNAAASTKHEREEGFNDLEGFLYRFRCLLSGLGESPFDGFSIAEERGQGSERLSTARRIRVPCKRQRNLG